jgi:hypothetical protein
MSDSILQIRPVTRDCVKIVLGLAGTSGGGKTYTALQLAYGLAGKDASKIGFLDTENRRGSLYAHIFQKPFLIGDLTAPFSPARYQQALMEFSQSGIEVLVVDSMSHEWEGEGGCDEIAQSAILRGKKQADWITAKREHHRFMRFLLSMPCHVISCFRAREKSDFSGAKPVSIGVQPICEKNVMFEMTASFMLDNGGKLRVPLKKIPEFFPFLSGDGYLTIEHGEKMREWAGGADPMERLKSGLRLAAGRGTEELKAAWTALGRTDQAALREFKDTLKDLANHAEAEKRAGKPDSGAPDMALVPEGEECK